MYKPGERFVFGGPRRVQVGRRVEQVGGGATAVTLSLRPVVARLDYAVVTRAINERVHARIRASMRHRFRSERVQVKISITSQKMCI